MQALTKVGPRLGALAEYVDRRYQFFGGLAAGGAHGSSSPCATIAKVAGFLSCLLFLRSHVIELRFIDHNLDRIVPTQIIVLGENCADAFFQIGRNFDFRLP